MTTTDGGSPRTLDSVSKALDVVEALWTRDGAGVTELAAATDLPKSTVHVHLSTLREKGYVVKDDPEYRLGLRFLTYGEYVKHAEPLYVSGKEPVEDLADRTGERVFCATHQNGLGTVLYLVAGDRSLQSNITVGTQMYLHCAGSGKAMLAHFSRERVDEIVDTWGLPSFTENTITTREALHEELERVRERGVAINSGEYRRGVETVAAPILGENGTVHGAIALAGPERRLRSEWDEGELHDHLLAAANTIEVDMART